LVALLLFADPFEEGQQWAQNDVCGYLRVSDPVDFFLIGPVDDQVLSLTTRDRHLDVMTCVTVEGAQLAITASVVTHNGFGRLYMVPVAPAHRLIVWAMLRRLRRL